MKSEKWKVKNVKTIKPGVIPGPLVWVKQGIYCLPYRLSPKSLRNFAISFWGQSFTGSILPTKKRSTLGS